MTHAGQAGRWSREEFLRAWEAGQFEHRVELIDGEVWPVSIGRWHGPTTIEVSAALRDPSVVVTTETLPSGDSLPDPDCWVRRRGAVPTGQAGDRIDTWAPVDVLLVVEVSKETVIRDLHVKSRLYGNAGWPVYWVVTQKLIYEHTEPHEQGYRTRVEYPPGSKIPVRYTNTELSVDDLIASK
ncbi:MAG: Uma2 family endonuclease [Micromonosporaceae bacterium]|nr:Uma2 family endonuclease [Micromonosporaceae bacterium]